MDSLLAGAVAGLAVDIGLYPIDTIKTRIQSSKGFIGSGGFANIYKGLSAVAIGSVPGGAVFFCTYDSVKEYLLPSSAVAAVGDGSADGGAGTLSPRVIALQAAAAMSGETAACCIRVPVETVKQRMQAGHHHSVMATLRALSTVEGPGAESAAARATRGLRALFKGMPIMLLRELPFSVIQMTLYERSKRVVRDSASLQPHSAYLYPLCGAASGGFAAFVTTPLDVLKTRIMLQEKYGGRGGFSLIGDAVSVVLREPSRPGDRFGSTQKFFRGAATRVLWISLGGAIFFGTYEAVKRILTPLHPSISHSINPHK